MDSPDFIQALNLRLSDFAKNLQVSQRVLAVDDEPAIQILITEYLASKSILADVASTAEEGLEHLNKNAYAVLVVDKNLPGMSGMTLLKHVKEHHPEIEVVVITAYASIESALEAISAGAFDYIPKPLPSLDYLSKKVRGALARHDFEVRVQSMIGFLTQECKSMLAALNGADQAGWGQKLNDILESHGQHGEPARILVYGSQSLTRSVEKMGYQAVTAKDLETAIKVAQEQDYRVLVLNEEDRSFDVSEIVRRFHAVCPDMGVFVIAREGDLNSIVSAIGVGVGDYLVRPLEGRELFRTRLERVVSRQQRIVRYRRVIEALKNLNIDLQSHRP